MVHIISIMVNKIVSNRVNGKWVVLLDENIIASGDNIKKILEEAKKKYPNGKFILAKVPEEGAMIY